MKQTKIIYFGKPCILQCDTKCNKAWGINSHPRIGDMMIDDNLLGEAPIDPGTYEGGQGKNPLSHNKWCARECERSKIIQIGENNDSNNLLG
jgi:hypothetical protein